MNDDIVIIIPCYNESRRFLKDQFNEFYEANPSFSFCFVNDGSTDDTSLLLKDLQAGRAGRIHVIDRIENRGKAESVREGMMHCVQHHKYSWIGFADADFATPLSELPVMLVLAKESCAILVMGSRFRRLGANIQRNPCRFYIGRVFATVISMILKVHNVYDTQCGAKIIRSDAVPTLFKDRFVSRWLFDVEILFRIMANYGRDALQKHVIEYPLKQWIEIKGSKLKKIDFIRLPIQLLKIGVVYRKKS